MDAIEFNSMGLESFYREMDAHAAKFKAIGALHNKLRFSRGVNQTLAMECDSVSPGFINSANPLGSFSVQPSKTGYRLAMEELSQVEMGLIAAAVAIGAAILYKIVKWIMKWFHGGESSGSDGAGDKSNTGSNYIAPDRVGTIITGSIDVINDLEVIKKDLISACVKAGNVSSMDISKQIEDITIGAYAPIGDRASENFDDFINKTGMAQFLLNMHDKALKEAPTKLRDAFNKLEQITNSYTSDTSTDHRIDAVVKLSEMLADAKKNASDSFWYQGGELGATTAKELTIAVKSEIEAKGKKRSTLGKELVGRTSNFTEKLRQGLHGTYEKLLVDVQRLISELNTDLQSKITSLEKQLKGHVASVGGKSNDPTDTTASDAADFSKNARQIVVILNQDIGAIGNLTAASKVICNDYLMVIKELTSSHSKIIKELSGSAVKYRATELHKALLKLGERNKKLTKTR